MLCSAGSVNSAMVHWRRACDRYGWEEVLKTDSPERGGRLAAFVWDLMSEDNNLTYDSIATYVWGMCTWQKLQHEADPRMGVMHWADFMSSVKVVAHTPGEPRKPFPMRDPVVRSCLRKLPVSNTTHLQEAPSDQRIDL